MTVFYYTFGCKVNQYETDAIRELMESQGYSTTNKLNLADVCVINTCTVTGAADIKLKQLLHKIKSSNPSAAVAVCGCFSQAYHASPLLSMADVIAGENNKSEVPDMIKKYFETGLKQKKILSHFQGEKIEPLLLRFGSGKTRAAIKIQDGCDRFCSYCIIPYARGRSRSKPVSEIVCEAKRLVASGHAELVLVGINLSCYGEDFKDGTTLADAVKAVCEESGAYRVRLGSIEPEMLTPQIISALSQQTKLCPQFHLSLQSGCDKTLSQMRRRYTTDDYMDIVACLRDKFPGCSITTDVMVGFPGETDEDFLESIRFVTKIGFAGVHVFPYSPREGTAAAKRTDLIPESVKSARAKLMSEAAEAGKKAYLHSLVGTVQSVLFEKEKDSVWHQGYAPCYTLVKVKRFTDTLRRQIRNVRIISVHDDFCIGEIEK